MSIITSNSPGAITLTSSNDNVVDITGTTADVQGLGASTITVNQAETANFNAATVTFSVIVAKPDPNIIDTDGDGVVDANDFIIDDDRIWSTSQFRFDTDAWGTVMFKKRSNGQLNEFYGNVASGYITPELESSPIGWSNKITWKARTDLSWVTFTKTSGSVVELERGSDGIKNVNTKGDKATFNVLENTTGSNRDGYVYIDYYYDNKFLITGREEIEQLAEKKIIELPDSTPLPSIVEEVIQEKQRQLSDGTNVPEEAVPDQKFDVCSEIAYYNGGEAFPNKIEVEIGSATGTAEFYFNAINLPDRFVLIHGGEVKFDSGYVTYASGSRLTFYQNLVNSDLSKKGLPSVTVSNHTVYGSGNEQFFTNWNKTSTDTKAYIYVYAPSVNTGWSTAVSCANQNLDNVRNLLRPGYAGG
jgi:hypothetical protein